MTRQKILTFVTPSPQIHQLIKFFCALKGFKMSEMLEAMSLEYINTLTDKEKIVALEILISDKTND